MPAEGMLDIPPREVTPDSGKGALGTWRAIIGHTTWALIQETVSWYGVVEPEV